MMKHIIQDGTNRSLSRRSFVKLAGVGTLGVAAASALSACQSSAPASTGDGTGDAGTTGTAGGDGDKTQVIIAMGTGNEPAAGFDPFFGWAASEHSHEPLIQSDTRGTVSFVPPDTKETVPLVSSER
jgi:peptide/nickel transport system substrate-binding protein